ncbi:MAG: arginine--tRNA ligase [Polyangiales bacterium]
MRLLAELDSFGRAAIIKAFGAENDSPALIRSTQDPAFGDYQMNAAMSLAKKLGTDPRSVAERLASALEDYPAIAKAEVAGPGFVNLWLNEQWIGERLTDSFVDRDRDGVSRTAAPQTIVVDFSSPNIAKQMHVGHLRSTIIGDSIAKTLSFVGHRVIRDNHIGDWGTQFGLLIVGMRKWGDDTRLQNEPIVELERVYKLASEQAKTDEAFAQEARDELAKLQRGDAANKEMWLRFVQASKTALEEVYDDLHVTFDHWLGESAYHDALAGTVELLKERALVRIDDGALCVFWNEIDAAPKALKN